MAENTAVISNKVPREDVFFLLNMLDNGGCIRCMNKSCNIKEKHGIDFPEKMCTFVKNPIYINGMNDLMEEANPDFNGKKAFFTICNYVHKKCRNCQEGRIKYINFNDKKIALCHPILDDIKTKITVGVHIDIKLIMRGHKYEVSFIPLDINEPLPPIKVLNHEVDTLNKISQIEALNIEFPSLSPANKTSPSKVLNVEFPSLSPVNKISSSKIMDYSIIKKIASEEKKVDDFKRDEHIEEEDNKKVVNDSQLLIKNKYLENINSDLNNELKKVKEELMKEKFKLKNSNIYEEIIYNIKTLNTRITEQFVNTHYSEYIIY